MALAGVDADRGWPVMIATDEEGGVVQRLRPCSGTSAFMAAGANADEEAASITRDSAQLSAFGFTMDMAPVADVTIGVNDPTIRTRAAGSDPRLSPRGCAAWTGLEAGGVTPVVKHFPGHGSVRSTRTRDCRTRPPIAELARSDLVPFADAI